MKLKIVNKMIAIMCAVSISSSCLVTPIGAIDREDVSLQKKAAEALEVAGVGAAEAIAEQERYDEAKEKEDIDRAIQEADDEAMARDIQREEDDIARAIQESEQEAKEKEDIDRAIQEADDEAMARDIQREEDDIARAIQESEQEAKEKEDIDRAIQEADDEAIAMALQEVEADNDNNNENDNNDNDDNNNENQEADDLALANFFDAAKIDVDEALEAQKKAEQEANDEAIARAMQEENEEDNNENQEGNENDNNNENEEDNNENEEDNNDNDDNNNENQEGNENDNNDNEEDNNENDNNDNDDNNNENQEENNDNNNENQEAGEFQEVDGSKNEEGNENDNNNENEEAALNIIEADKKKAEAAEKIKAILRGNQVRRKLNAKIKRNALGMQKLAGVFGKHPKDWKDMRNAFDNIQDKADEKYRKKLQDNADFVLRLQRLFDNRKKREALHAINEEDKKAEAAKRQQWLKGIIKDVSKDIEDKLKDDKREEDVIEKQFGTNLLEKRVAKEIKGTFDITKEETNTLIDRLKKEMEDFDKLIKDYPSYVHAEECKQRVQKIEKRIEEIETKMITLAIKRRIRECEKFVEEATKELTWLIQTNEKIREEAEEEDNKLDAVVEMFDEADKEADKKAEAAEKIQARFRGNKLRQKLNEEAARNFVDDVFVEAKKEAQDKKAVDNFIENMFDEAEEDNKLDAVVEMFGEADKKAEEEDKKKAEAAEKIQARFRGNKLRQKLLIAKIRRNAYGMQTLAHVFHEHPKDWKDMRNAFDNIQDKANENYAKKLQKNADFVLRLQRLFDNRKKREALHAINEEDKKAEAAEKIQARFRGNKLRQKLLIAKIRRNAYGMQTLAGVFHNHPKDWKDMRNAFDNIQDRANENYAKKLQDNADFVLRLQRLFDNRKKREALHAINEEDKKAEAAAKIQAVWRGKKVRQNKKAVDNFIKDMFDGAEEDNKLDAVVEMFDEADKEADKKAEAAEKIQAAFRSKKLRRKLDKDTQEINDFINDFWAEVQNKNNKNVKNLFKSEEAGEFQEVDGSKNEQKGYTNEGEEKKNNDKNVKNVKNVKNPFKKEEAGEFQEVDESKNELKGYTNEGEEEKNNDKNVKNVKNPFKKEEEKNNDNNEDILAKRDEADEKAAEKVTKIQAVWRGNKLRDKANRIGHFVTRLQWLFKDHSRRDVLDAIKEADKKEAKLKKEAQDLVEDLFEGVKKETVEETSAARIQAAFRSKKLRRKLDKDTQEINDFINDFWAEVQNKNNKNVKNLFKSEEAGEFQEVDESKNEQKVYTNDGEEKKNNDKNVKNPFKNEEAGQFQEVDESKNELKGYTNEGEEEKNNDKNVKNVKNPFKKEEDKEAQDKEALKNRLTEICNRFTNEHANMPYDQLEDFEKQFAGDNIKWVQNRFLELQSDPDLNDQKLRTFENDVDAVIKKIKKLGAKSKKVSTERNKTENVNESSSEEDLLG